jgi:hypothetical protein
VTDALGGGGGQAVLLAPYFGAFIAMSVPTLHAVDGAAPPVGMILCGAKLPPGAQPWAAVSDSMLPPSGNALWLTLYIP